MKMILSALAVSCSLLHFSTSALACADQKNKAIFTDDFSDDSGGWEPDPALDVANGTGQVKVGGKLQQGSTLNVIFNATIADYCLEVGFPSSPAEAGNSDDAGIYFLGSDYYNRYAFSIDTDGDFWITRTANGKSAQLAPATKSAAVKKEPGSVNTLRVIVKDQKAAFSINGEQVKVIRLPSPDKANRFGFWMGGDKAVPKSERVFTLKSYQVTESN